MARLQRSLQKGQPNTPHDKSGALGSRSPTPQATRAQVAVSPPNTQLHPTRHCDVTSGERSGASSGSALLNFYPRDVRREGSTGQIRRRICATTSSATGSTPAASRETRVWLYDMKRRIPPARHISSRGEPPYAPCLVHARHIQASASRKALQIAAKTVIWTRLVLPKACERSTSLEETSTC